MVTSPVRILVVDDYEPWCRLVCSTLEKHRQLQVIGVVSDGLEAVRKAKELQPDLILLDMGLPKMNGIEACTEIGPLSPRSKVVFLTQETSSDLVEQALHAGAHGYVCKANAQRELLSAIEAVLRGEQFLSSRVQSRPIDDAARVKQSSRHEVMFYSDDSGFIDGLNDFITTTLKAGKTAMVIATKSHREGLVQRLKTDSFDIDRAIHERTYIALDSLETLGAIIADGAPDRTRLFETVGSVLDSASNRKVREQSHVAACGECAPLLLLKGEPETAIRVEQLFDELTRTRRVDLLCAYPMSSFPGGQEDPVFKRICAEHSAVYFR